MEEDPFAFAWPVDQGGYEIQMSSSQMPGEEAFDVAGRGGPPRFYRALDIDGLWLRFAQTCSDAEGALSFVNEFGLLGPSLMADRQPLDVILKTARQIREIWCRHNARERAAAIRLFNQNLPTMKAGILWYEDEPGRLHYRLIPVTLHDALLYQAGEAITGNRRFRRCRNSGCPNWFRLGPHAPGEGRHRQTITARREFCSDRCRVASARRQKKEAITNA